MTPEPIALPSANGKPIIELRQLVKTFRSGAGEFPVLKSLDLTLNRGEFVAIVGKSGSGKSTLLNMITGIDAPTDGEVHVAGHPIHGLNENDLARWRGRQVGVVFQFFQLLPALTVLENVILPMDFCNVYPRSEREERAMHWLERVGIPEQAHKLPSQLSGGQQQRAAIARALANDPPLVVADEPTGNLDSKTAREVFDLFNALDSEGKTMVVVTHDKALSERAERVLHLLDGSISRDEDLNGAYTR